MKKITSNYRGYYHARNLIKAGKINKVDEFNFTTADKDILLGDAKNNLDALSAFCLGKNIDAVNPSAEMFEYPYGKDGFVYRSALEDIIVVAGKAGHTEVIELVNELLTTLNNEEMQPSLDLQINVQAAWDEKENEIRHRIQSPDQFDTCRQKDLSAGIRGVFCRMKDDKKTWKLQSLRFDKDKFSIDEAKAWLKKHPISASLAEAEIDTLQTCEPIEIENSIQTTFDDSLTLLAGVNKSKENSGMVWEVVIMKAGFAPAKPPVYISKQALKASIASFHNARVYALDNADYFGHKTDRAKKGIKEIVGVLKDPYVVGDELRASFHIKPSATWLKDDLVYFANNDMLKTYQLSIDSGFYQEGTIYSPEVKQNIPNVVAVGAGDVDIVPNGAAGGEFKRMVASNSNSQNHKGVTQMKNKLLQVFMALFPTVFMAKNIDVVGIDENELYSFLYAADKSQPRMYLPESYDKAKVEPILDKALAEIQASKEPAKEPPEAPALDIQGALNPIQREISELRKQNCASMLRASLSDSKLPDAAKKRIEARWSGKIFIEAELINDINGEREYLAQFANPAVDNRNTDIRMTADEQDKMEASLAAAFLTSGERMKPLQAGSAELKALVGDAVPLRSIKQLYIDFTGDVNVTGRPEKMTKLQGSIDTTQFSVIVGNALNKALVADYNAMPFMADVQKISNIVDLNSIQEQKRIRYGGYADLSTVTEGSEYLAMSSPDDEQATYTPAKKGGTEDITLETIKKDDVGAVNKIPSRIARAASRTLYKAVFDLVDPGTNAAIYDVVVLYHTVSHANLGANALDSTYLKAAMARLAAHTEANSSEVLGIEAGYLLVPIELEGTAYELVTSAYGVYNQTPSWVQTKGIEVIRVAYWSGETPGSGAAAKNWALVSKRAYGVPIEVGFVDGQQTPELFVSNLANIGSLFTHDKITYKVRHWWGCAIIDYRFLDGSQVS